MAVRDHFRLDVLVRVAARLQEVDAELGEVERLLRMEDAGAAGECPGCGALHGRGAQFCWQCGHQLMAAHTPEFHHPVTEPSHPPERALR
jgi:predicted amidophosphoribosyltransferase